MITVQALLGRPHLHIQSLWCPNPLAKLRWVATSEQINPATFLEGNELLLTTSAGNPEGEADWLEYAQRLVSGGISTLGFGLGFSYDTVPPLLVQAARKTGLNLIEVAPDQSFVALSQEVARMIEVEATSGKYKLTALQQRLIQASAQPRSVDMITGELARGIGARVIIRDKAGRIVAQASAPTLSADLGKFAEQSWEGFSETHSLRSFESSAGYCLFTSIDALGQETAWLQVCWNVFPHPWQQQALSQAGLLIASALANSRFVSSYHGRLLQRAFTLLLSGELGAAQILTEMAFPDARVLSGRYVPVVVAGEEGDLRALAARVERAVTKTMPPPLWRFQADNLEMAIPVAALPLTLSNFSRKELSALRAGVGQDYPISRFSAGLPGARQALRHTGNTQQVARWGEISRSGLLQVMGRETVAAFSQQFLLPLRGEAELVELLEQYVATKGNRQQMAKTLGLHRNTVAKRLEKLQSKLGINLAEAGAQASAWVALQGREP
ncbi:PucR family transcriptional regulator [Varibaculum cambriense]|uniref:PucR family transcriptional regulator n=1 Tax=Varibaculum cambriense TaxID=184870 RepID=A0ABX4UPK7_9ACTO|nr:PucR family transcriptional regulator [Varibaculum cambriense]PMB88954.1 hypothetical protein CJ240_08055 [Varibaculum cambriense]